MDAQPATLDVTPGFGDYAGRNIGLYLLAILLWGVPAVAGLADFSTEEGPPVLGMLWMALGLGFLGIFPLLALLAPALYLAIVYRAPHRRAVAIVLSPLSVFFLFFFVDGVMESAVIVGLGASYGASLWFPDGPRAWWERRPRLVAVAAGAWLVVVAAVALVQPLPAGVQLEADATTSDAGLTRTYRLECEYDRAGRIRAAIAVRRAHPGGIRACEILDRELGDERGPVQRGCPRTDRSADYVGRFRDRPFQLEVVYADCEEAAFGDGELDVLVPLLRS